MVCGSCAADGQAPHGGRDTADPAARRCVGAGAVAAERHQTEHKSELRPDSTPGGSVRYMIYTCVYI